MRNGKIVGRARACGFFEAATKQWPRSWTTPSHCWWWSLSESLVKFWRLNDAMAAFPLAIVRLWNHMGLSVESHGFETSSSDIQKTQEPGPVVMFFIYSTMSTCDKKAVVFFWQHNNVCQRVLREVWDKLDANASCFCRFRFLGQHCTTEIANRVADLLGKQLVKILLTNHFGHFAGKLVLEKRFCATFPRIL